MAGLDVVKVAGNTGGGAATTVYVMKSSDGTRDGALMLLGTAAIVPDVGAIRIIAGEFAFTTRVPGGTVDPGHIVVLDNLGLPIAPRTVTVDPLSVATLVGDRVKES